MNFKIEIDRNSNHPIYKQIMDSITSSVEEGKIKYGARLPTERELAQASGVARGTVKKAYEELERQGIISIIWGSGAYLTKKPPSFAVAGGEAGIRNDLAALFRYKEFTEKEMEIFIKINLAKNSGTGKVHLAIIDDNAESLLMYKKQLSYISGLFCFLFLLDDIKASKNIRDILNEIDIILITTVKDEELMEKLAFCEDKVMEAAVSPGNDTILKLFRLREPNKTGILTKSRRFKEIINHNLAVYEHRIVEKNCMYEKWANPADFSKFIQDKQTLIMPPVYTLDLHDEAYDALFKFACNGGEIITFHYTIGKGSVVRVEERISNIVYNYKGW